MLPASSAQMASISLRALLALISALSASCVKLLDEEEPEVRFPTAPDAGGPLALAELLESPCIYQGNGAVDDAMSLSFSQGPRWIFLHAAPTEGAPGTSSAKRHSVEGATSPCAKLEPVRDERGGLSPVLALDADEQAFNEDNLGVERVTLWPISGLVVEDRGLLFYRKMLLLEDGFPIVLGVGVAEISFGGAAERLAPAIYPAEPTLLWVSPQTSWGTGSLLGADGLIYVYGCDASTDSCDVARVGIDRVNDPTAYEYYAGPTTGWSRHIELATAVVAGTEFLSVAANPRVTGYLAVARGADGEPWSATSPTPWGPFGDTRPLLLDPIGPAVGAIRQHTSYQSDDGSQLLIGYFESVGQSNDLTLARLRIEP
jgi:hypothetical protein